MSAIEYVWNSTHYANRKIRSALHLRGCRVKQHNQVIHRKSQPSCGGAYKCVKCGKIVGWCRGGHEGSERDDWCDGCWYKSELRREKKG